MEEYKRLKRELVANGAILDYYQDTILIPNGNVAKWDLIDHKGAAAVVAVRTESLPWCASTAMRWSGRLWKFLPAD